MTLVVQEGEGEHDIDSKMNFESNQVKQADFGEYVASLHSCNNSTFILQYQVQVGLMSVNCYFYNTVTHVTCNRLWCLEKKVVKLLLGGLKQTNH